MYEIRYATVTGREGSMFSTGRNCEDAIDRFICEWIMHGDPAPTILAVSTWKVTN